MKKIYALFALTFLLVHCASQPLALESRNFSSEPAFKVISEVNRIIPLFQGKGPTVRQVTHILQEPMEYDLSSGHLVSRMEGYTITARFEGELKEEDTVLSQMNWNLAPNEILTYEDVQTAFGPHYITIRQNPSVVVRHNLGHAKKVEFLVHMGEPATNLDQPVRSLLLRSAK